MYHSTPPPPPPPPRPETGPQPTPNYAVSSEPYGAVHVPMTPSQPVTQRRPHVTTTPLAPPPPRVSPYVLRQPEYTVSGSSLSNQSSKTSTTKKKVYQHNGLIAVYLGIPFSLFLLSHVSQTPLQVFLYVGLVIYASDLANLKEWTLSAFWVGWFVMTVTNLWTTLLEMEDGNSPGGSMLVALLRIFVESLLFLCMATWGTLQLNWLYGDSKAVVRMAERVLHTSLVPVASAVVCQILVEIAKDFLGMDRAAVMSPHILAVSMTACMLGVGCTDSSFSEDSILSSTGAKIHSVLLLLLPGSMHLLMFRKRILSFYASYDDWCDVVLVWSVPYLLLYLVQILHWNDTRPGPYSMRILFGMSGNTLRGAFVPIAVSLVASLALEHKYLIPLCQTAAYQFLGHNLPSSAWVATMLTLAVFFTLFSVWVNGRKSSKTNELLFGDYHEDVVQLSLAVTGLLVGKAVGMPWTLTPLPILACLGLVVWSATRMLRYLMILLFVIHSTGVVLLSYRYAGLEASIALAIPGAELQLFRFGMLTIIVSLLIFLVMGLAVRSSGGYGAKLLKEYDLAGALLVVYSIMMAVLECTLLKLPMPYKDLQGIEMHAADPMNDMFAYSPMVSYGTSLVIGAIAAFLYRYKVVASDNAVFGFSLALGKAMAVYVDSKSFQKPSDDHAADSLALLLRCTAATVTIMIMIGPRATMDPVHVKSSSGSWKRGGVNGKPASHAPSSVSRKIMLYGLLLLPMALAFAVPVVLKPLVEVLTGRAGSATHHTSSTPASEIFGFAAMLWGLSMLSMLNHFLPDGGGESWKKASALALLMGLGLIAAAPTLPEWLLRGRKGSVSALNPYAMLSSFGSDVAKSGRSGAGGWGLVSAALATLLAITGPLELKERSSSDKSMLARAMLFSLMFGCGVAWFITLQLMSEEAFLPVFVTTSSCMAMSFFGAVAGVLGYALELEEFEEAIQIVQVWAVAFPIFGLVSAASQFARNVAHPFGVGGWLSTYLTMCGCIAIGYTVTLRCRTSKSPATRAVSNLSCIFSWICSMIALYGRYGVAGLDANFAVTTVFGIPAPVIGTVVLSMILVGLEGEKSGARRGGRVQRLGRSTKPTTTSFGITFQDLNSSNWHAIPLLSIAAVFLFASLYTVLLRGCGIFQVATNHSHVFDAVYSQGDAADEDLATLAEKNMIHSQALMTSARLASSSIWTAKSLMGPGLQLAGLAATLPSLFVILSHMWKGGSTGWARLFVLVPLNMFPLIMCKGNPTLRALSVLCLISGAVLLMNLQSQDRRSKMRI